MIKKIFLFTLCLAAAACQYMTPEKEISDDPKVRAMDLNDSAVELMERSPVFNAKGAVEVFKRSIALDSTYDKPWVNMIGVHLQRKQFSEAMESLNGLEKLKPEVPEVHMTKGLLYEKLNDPLNAGEEYRYAIRLWENSLPNLDTAGPVYQDMQAKRLTALLLLDRKDQVLQEYPGADTGFDKNKDILLAEFWKSIPLDKR